MPTVLIIDDERTVVDIVSEALGDEGYQVIGAGNGAAGLSALRRAPPNLVLLDVHMPVLDGPATLRFIRCGVGGKELPVVLMSADPKAAVLCPSADGVLRKPFEVEELLDLVRRFAGPPAA